MKNKQISKQKQTNPLAYDMLPNEVIEARVADGAQVIQVPEKLAFLVNTKSRYKVAYGGRGGGKSRAFAGALIYLSLQKKIRVLCTREIQKSIQHSVHKILSDEIARLKLTDYFYITREGISNRYGSEFIFKGLRSDITQIKSLEGIDICWVEEAAKVSENSWKELIPTIRNEGAEIWVSFNPDEEEDPTFQRFVKSPPPKWKFNETTRQLERFFTSVEINYPDNPWFTNTLRAEMEEDRRKDENLYKNVWLGMCRQISEAQIFKNKFRVADFETPHLDKITYNRFFQGADWGFSNDPMAAVRCFIKDKRLWIDYAVGDRHIEINELDKIFNEIPDVFETPIYADSARPETISYCQNVFGLPIAAAKKWQGSVEDGITFMRSFDEIIVHPRCIELIKEFKYYSYKIDKTTGKILRKPVDAWNHWIDAIRYALFELIYKDEDSSDYSVFINDNKNL